jgi:hypothetical protein
LHEQKSDLVHGPVSGNTSVPSRQNSFDDRAFEFSISDYDKFNEECRLPECRDFKGKIESVIPDAEGAKL